MALSKDKIQKYFFRLIQSRIRILMNHGFYGLLLMNAKLSIDENVETAYTDGKRIVFGTKFLDSLRDNEIDFILMHEILHIALRHCVRGKEKDNELFNIACDIVVNSNILKSNNMNINSITLKQYGEAMHVAPNKREGYLYTAEEVYEMLLSNNKRNASSGNKQKNVSIDDHSKWNPNIVDNKEWIQKVINAKNNIQNRRLAGEQASNIPSGIERMYNELVKSKVDWKTILCDFVQETVCDYSFSPPDRRFSEEVFFLPDFNDTEKEVKNILFMVDTSGSIKNDAIIEAFSEVKGAIDQFNGKLQGYLGFFDAQVIPPVQFESVDDLLKIKPYGGGGTRFDIIFEYINNNMQDNLPKCIIILTDGYAEFPNEAIANNIPVLWIISNSDVTPPWGKIVKIDSK